MKLALRRTREAVEALAGLSVSDRMRADGVLGRLFERACGHWPPAAMGRGIPADA